MKFKSILLFLLGILLTGCGNKTVETISCIYQNTNEGTEYKTEVLAEVNKDGIIKNAVATINFQDENLAKEMCSNLSVANDVKNVKCEEKKITIKNYHKSISGKNKMTKEDFLEYMDDNRYVCE